MQSDIVPAPRDEVRTFWTGPVLSYYEILSLKSLMATGAKVFVYSYEKDLVVPDGVELVDAADVLAGDVHEFRHANGDKSLALHSDLFRYVVLQKYGGWYADLDIICMRDKLPPEPTYFAFMANKLLNSAILKFPPRSAFMEAILEEAWRILPGAGMATTDAARVSVGPTLFTQFVYDYALDHLVLPKSKAYELGYHETMAFFDPAKCESTMERLAGSDFTHLWNEEWRMIRIPKNFGPPKGSFLDVMFERFDIEIPERARLPAEAIEAWMREHRLLKDIRLKLGIERVGEFTLDELALSIQTFGWDARDHVYYHWFYGIEHQPPKIPKHSQTTKPETLRTFWHGDSISPYQLLCLKSFVDRGHRVEVFSYNLQMTIPAWLTLRDAHEILPSEQVIYPTDQGWAQIHANLFRYALLQQLGGWWIDPDVLLMKPDMPDGDIFIGEADAFGRVPTTLLKFPAGHPVIESALLQTQTLGEDYRSWERAGSEMLTSTLDEYDPRFSAKRESLGPISWFNVLDLFNPQKAIDLSERCSRARFLHLQNEVWRRAGVHPWLAAPEGSYLDALFALHDVGIKFPARMYYNQINRWIKHMYASAQIEQAQAFGR